MRLLLLAFDYDGTLAHDGKVAPETIEALEKAIASGRKLVMVTGRELDDLFENFDRPELFEWIVAENGAVAYHPVTRERHLLSEPPSPVFIAELERRGVAPFSTGDVIVSTWQPQEQVILAIIRELSLELQVIFNKGAVMVLPGGVNKASGLLNVLTRMGMSPHNVLGAGDAENDHSFLKVCECSVAVANALPAVREIVDWTTEGSHGEGVQELLAALIKDEKGLLDRTRRRHEFAIGKSEDSQPIIFDPHSGNVLVAGSSGAGKSTLATSIMEGLTERKYQFCIIDPEGDYLELENATILGTSQRPPTAEELFSILERSTRNVVYSMVGVPLLDRPAEFLRLLSRLQSLRAHHGRPHWIVIDEAHHVLPADSSQAPLVVPRKLDHCIFITMNPEQVHESFMSPVDLVLGVGDKAPEVMQVWSRISGAPLTLPPEVNLEKGEALLWRCRQNFTPLKIVATPSRSVRKRHRRKYAEGELPEDRSFYFRGAEGKLNLRAHNLITFIQMADGIDSDTWLYHLRRNEYSQWLRDAIKDTRVAEQIKNVEDKAGDDVKGSKSAIRNAIEKEYTLPVKSLATEKVGADQKTAQLDRSDTVTAENS